MLLLLPFVVFGGGGDAAAAAVATAIATMVCSLPCYVTDKICHTCNSYRLMEISFMHSYVRLCVLRFRFLFARSLCHCICALVHLYSSIKWLNCMGVTACAVAG